MFTVLIAEKEHIDAIQNKNKLFFEPFHDSKDIAFCYWNPMGETLLESLPGLIDAVGRRKEWRAVIIHHVNDENRKKRNPFDMIEAQELIDLKTPEYLPKENEVPKEWEDSWIQYFNDVINVKEKLYTQALSLPLQKLSTWLCFKPEDYIHNDIVEHQSIEEWAISNLSQDELHPSNRLDRLERDYSKKELRLKERLRREFLKGKFLNVSYPSEVYVISQRCAENNYFDPNNYWNIRHDSQYSTFTDRNMYFDKMRFLTYDILPTTHRNYRTDYINFLATVLIFITNEVPGSALQSRKLYCLEVQSNEEPMYTLVTSFYKKLSATNDIIVQQMEKIQSMIPGAITDKQAEQLFCKPMQISVALDNSCDVDAIEVDDKYGFFYDLPTNEEIKWGQDYRLSREALRYIMRQTSRSIRKSVTQTHLSSEVSDIHISRLTPLQIEDVKDFSNNEEHNMVDAIPNDLTDMSLHQEKLNQASQEVQKVIDRRMTLPTVLLLTGICVLIYALCFLPFIIGNYGSMETATTAFILTAFSIASLIIILLICLFFLRRTLIKAVDGYNNTSKDVMNDIRNSMKQFSKYLSALCNVRRGHKIQNYAKQNIDTYTKYLRIRKKHQEDIRKIKAQIEEEYRDYLRDGSYVDETMSRPYEYDFDQTTEYYYPVPFDVGDYSQIEFISRGNYVIVPSSYITKIIVRMEDIYEK